MCARWQTHRLRRGARVSMGIGESAYRWQARESPCSPIHEAGQWSADVQVYVFAPDAAQHCGES